VLSTDRLLDGIGRHAGAFADAVLAADLDATVPACPDWSVRDLAAHLGGVHRWATDHVAERRQKLVRRGPTDPPAPTDPEAIAAWVREGGAALVAALRDTDPDTPVGGFGRSVTVGWWARRQCHETLVHRGDAEIAAGRAPFADVDPEVASDAVDEHLEMIMLASTKRTALHGRGETLHLHVTDAPGEWLITREAEDLRLERDHAKADVALRGPATTLLGVVTNRVTPEHAEVLGDADLLGHWLAHATV
jgi:uncharacterized protein (TIGR03083 family)